MDKDKLLNEIFENDPLGLLNVKPNPNPVRNEDERLVASFQEIVNFYETNRREPEQNKGIQEYQLYSRLKSIRENPTKIEMLRSIDKFGLLNFEQTQITSIDDIINNDTLGLLNSEEASLFEFKHIKNPSTERAASDFVARRKPCKDFEKYEELFKDVQRDLASSKRKLIPFKEDNIVEGSFYVVDGVLLLLENINITSKEQTLAGGKRIRKDGRTRCIFENGTESNMLYRSLAKSLYANGQVLTENVDLVNESFIVGFSNITEEDKEAGYIYILKSKSENPKIKELHNLYKIGYSKITVEERIKNAIQEPTYLMAEVRIVMTYKCYNLNPQKLELLLHNFFGNSCLNLDIFDKQGNRHTPREWFIAPLNIIEQAIHLIISGEVIKYKYDAINEQIVKR